MDLLSFRTHLRRAYGLIDARRIHEGWNFGRLAPQLFKDEICDSFLVRDFKIWVSELHTFTAKLEVMLVGAGIWYRLQDG